MKRYWKLIVLVAIIVLTIGTFYFKQSLASSNYPEMELQTKSGDEKVAKNLILHTNVRTRCVNCGGTGGGRSVDITTEGSTGEKDSFLDSIRGNPDPKVIRLQKDQRNFMRGKAGDPNLFAENKHAIVYADFVLDDDRSPDQNYDMNVDWLDKKTDDHSSFKMQIPDHEKYRDVYVRHVYITGDQVKVVTENRKNGTETTDIELHVYTVDPNAGEIIDDDMVLSGSENMDNDNWVSMNVFAGDEEQGELDTLILTKEKGKNSEVEDITEPSSAEMVYYDLQTKKRKELSLPNEWQGQAIEAFDGNMLYISERKDGKVTIAAYDINDQAIKTKHTMELPDSMKASEIRALTTQVNSGKLYIISDEQKEKQATTVIIVDIQSGKSVYEGTIAMDDAIEDYDVNIHQITLQNEAGR